jgi:hypothetical protein
LAHRNPAFQGTTWTWTVAPGGGLSTTFHRTRVSPTGSHFGCLSRCWLLEAQRIILPDRFCSFSQLSVQDLPPTTAAHTLVCSLQLPLQPYTGACGASVQPHPGCPGGPRLWAGVIVRPLCFQCRAFLPLTLADFLGTPATFSP